MDHDFCNVDGARRLKQKIEDYWRERGYTLEVKLVEAGFVAAMRSARTDVRSDMQNGLPSRRCTPTPKPCTFDPEVLAAAASVAAPQVANDRFEQQLELMI